MQDYSFFISMYYHLTGVKLPQELSQNREPNAEDFQAFLNKENKTIDDVSSFFENTMYPLAFNTGRFNLNRMLNYSTGSFKSKEEFFLIFICILSRDSHYMWIQTILNQFVIQVSPLSASPFFLFFSETESKIVRVNTYKPHFPCSKTLFKITLDETSFNNIRRSVTSANRSY